MLIKGFQKTTLLDYPDVVASLVFTGGCNFRCPFCHNSELVLHPQSFPTIMCEVVLQHLRKRKGIIDGLVITGGEPTVLNGLIPFIRAVKEEGVLVKLDTNGYKPDVLAVLLADGLVDYIAMDIKSTFEKYSAVSGIDGVDTNKVEESIKIIMSSNIRYEFRTTVIKEFHDKADLLEIGHMIEGAQKFVLQQYVHSDEQLDDKKFTFYTREEMQVFRNEIETNSAIKEVELRCKY